MRKKTEKINKTNAEKGTENRNSFALFKEEIHEKNAQTLMYLSVSCIFISVITLTISLSFNLFGVYSYAVYGLWGIASAAVFALCKWAKKFTLSHATLLLYLFTAVLFFSAITVGTVLWRDSISTVAIGAIVVLAFILLDRVLNFCLYELCLSALFCTLSLISKPRDIAIVDCLNAIGFTILSCVMGLITIKSKLCEIQSKAVITRQRDTDELTGLCSRTAAQKTIDAYISQIGEKAVMFIIDVDDFKRINDGYGHLAGDKALIEVARAIKGCFRQTDCVGRLGGDEFIAFMTGCEDDRPLRQCALINETIASLALTPPVTVSVGAVVFDGGQSFEQLYVEADKALYFVKENGKNACKLYAPPPPEERHI